MRTWLTGNPTNNTSSGLNSTQRQVFPKHQLHQPGLTWPAHMGLVFLYSSTEPLRERMKGGPLSFWSQSYSEGRRKCESSCYQKSSKSTLHLLELLKLLVKLVKKQEVTCQNSCSLLKLITTDLLLIWHQFTLNNHQLFVCTTTWYNTWDHLLRVVC